MRCALCLARHDNTTVCDDCAAIERDGQIVASYRVHSDDIDAAETIGAQVSREIGEAMRRAGWRFVDAGGGDPGVFEVWAQPEAEYHLHHAGRPIHGAGNTDREWLALYAARHEAAYGVAWCLP